MADLSRQKALAERLLSKVSTSGVVTVKSTALNATVAAQTANVHVKLLDRKAGPTEPTKIEAIMSATPFPVEGGELLLNGITYSIVSVTQSGVGNEHIVQRVVLHEQH